MRLHPLAALVATLALAAPVHGSELPSSSVEDGHGRFFAGTGISYLRGELAIDDRPVDGWVDWSYQLEAGYLRRVLGAHAIGLSLKGATFSDMSAFNDSEWRYRLDLGLLVELSYPVLSARPEQPWVFLTAGFGPTVAWLVPPERRRVVERYGPGWGLHTTFRFGSRLCLNGRHLPYYALESTLHRISAKHRASVRGAGPPPVTEHHRFDDFTLGFVIGYALSR
jgi:hypothetical protein